MYFPGKNICTPAATVAALLCVAGGFAQGLTLRGEVWAVPDSAALPGATVLTGDGGRINTVCDEAGRFILKGVARRPDTLQVVHLGFAAIKVPFAVPVHGNEVIFGRLYVSETENPIETVVVRGQAPMSVQKGDTTQFNAEAFKAHPDADAGDLITKMPGVVIQSGKIEAQGEPVRRIYVDGKLFFGTDPMAALKNLPADAIESIQFFDEQSEMSRYTGFDDGNSQKVINIVTKTKDREALILKGEASAGADAGEGGGVRYLTGGNFSHFTERQRITLTGLFNNVNTAKFGQNDLLESSEVDDNGNLKNQPAGLRRITGAGVNYSLETKVVKFSGSYFYDRTSSDLVRESERNYFPDPDGDFMSKRSRSSRITSATAVNNRMSFKLELRPDKKNSFELSPRITLYSNDEASSGNEVALQSKTSGTPTDSLSRSSSLNPSLRREYSIAGSAVWSHRFGKPGRSFTSGLDFNFTNVSTDRYRRDLYRDSYNTTTGEWKPARDTIDRLEDQDVANNFMRVRITWSEPIVNRHRVLLNINASRDWGGSDKESNLFDRATGGYTRFEALQSSSFDKDYRSVGGGVGYAFWTKPLSVNAGVDYQNISQLRNEYLPNEVETRFRFTNFQPTFSLKYSIEKSRYLRLRYQGRTILPRIDQMQNVVNTNSAFNWRVGNPDLKPGYQNSLTLFYNASNQQKSTNFTLTLDARANSNYIATITESLPMDTVIYASLYGDTTGRGFRTAVDGIFLHKQTNLDGYFSARSSATYSFVFRPIRSNVNLSASYNFVRAPSIYGSVHNFAMINSGAVRVGVTSNISHNIDFNFYSNTAFNFTGNTSRANSSFLNQNFYYSVNLLFPGGIVLGSLVTWKYYSSSTATGSATSFLLVDAGIGKKFFKRRNGEFRITAYDIFARNKNLLHYIHTTYIEDVRTNTLGRYILARFSYNFNSMTSSPRQGKSSAWKSVEDTDSSRYRSLTDVR